MTKEEAVANLNMISVAFVEPVTKDQRKLIDDTFDMAIEALEQEPYREIEDYENEIEDLHNRLNIAEYDKERLREEVTRLEEKIKLSEQEPKTGHWIDTGRELYKDETDDRYTG